MKAKEKHKANLLSYLGDPEKEFPKRKDYPGILGVSKKTIYKHFTALDLTEIEYEAVEIRKKTSSRQRSNVLKALYSRAIGYSHPDIHINCYEGEIIITDITKYYPPDKPSAQEYLDRTEGKVPDKVELSGNKENKPIINVEFTRNKS